MTIEQTLTDLEAKARAATAGPWQACGHERGGCKCGFVWSVPGNMLIATRPCDEDVPVPTEAEAKSNALFIAAAHPQAVLALIAAARTALPLRQMVDDTPDHLTSDVAALAAFDAALAALEGKGTKGGE